MVKYEKPEIEVITFGDRNVVTDDDVIRSSPVGGVGDGGESGAF